MRSTRGSQLRVVRPSFTRLFGPVRRTISSPGLERTVISRIPLFASTPAAAVQAFFGASVAPGRHGSRFPCSRVHADPRGIARVLNGFSKASMSPDSSQSYLPWLHESRSPESAGRNLEGCKFRANTASRRK